MLAMLYAVSMGTIVVRKVPEDLHLQFKLLCTRNRISMNKSLIELMRQAVEKAEKRQK